MVYSKKHIKKIIKKNKSKHSSRKSKKNLSKKYRRINKKLRGGSSSSTLKSTKGSKSKSRSRSKSEQTLKEKISKRVEELNQIPSRHIPSNKSKIELDLIEKNKFIAIKILENLNQELKKFPCLENFKTVIIGGFAINKHVKHSKLSFLSYDTEDIDVKICGSLKYCEKREVE